MSSGSGRVGCQTATERMRSIAWCIHIALENMARDEPFRVAGPLQTSSKCWNSARYPPIEFRHITGTPRYTELAGVSHNSWTAAYTDGDLYAWLFAKTRSNR